MTALSRGLKYNWLDIHRKITGSQDDGFVGVLKKNIPNKLALLGVPPSEKSYACKAKAPNDNSSSYPWLFASECSKTNTATTGEVFGSEHSFLILTDPAVVTATFIA
jgi:hypothetical protein